MNSIKKVLTKYFCYDCRNYREAYKNLLALWCSICNHEVDEDNYVEREE